MQVSRVVSAAIVAAAMAGIPAGAQGLDGPKEPPPAGFTGNQYVDSAGCVFIRAGVGGQTTWVARVNRDRKLVCGYEPTVAPESATAEAEAGEAIPAEPVATAGVSVAETEVPLPVPAAMPAQAAKPIPAAKPAPVRRRAAVPLAKGPVRLVRAAPVTASATLCLERIDAAQRYLLSDGRRVTQCGGTAPDEPVAWLNGLAVPGLEVASGAPSAAEAGRALRADRGAYRVVWQNGEIAAPSPAPAAAPDARPGVGPGGYVQVGVFADPANAGAAIARLTALGLPVASATGRSGGRAVKAIMAGPFASAADLHAALATARRAGYADAYIRG